MHITPMTEADRFRRKMIMNNADELKNRGICPTCQNFTSNDVYPSNQDCVFYEDDLLNCFLERYPRNPGHTIVMVKPHYEDISVLPVEASMHVFNVIQKAIAAIRKVLGPEKVYLCTMCDGKRNHLHFLLIPRYRGDIIRGSKLFVKERQILKECTDVTYQLKTETTP